METTADNKKIINHYLTTSIKRYFGLDIDVNNEYIFAKNLVSKKNIIVTTFSDAIFSRPEIKLFLSSLITELNNESCSIEFINENMNYLSESGSDEMEKIV